MYLVTVLPLSKKARTDTLSYYYGSDIPLGTLVEVPFRSKPLRAMVTDSKPLAHNKSEIKEASYTLKKVTKVISENIFSKELFEVCREVSDFYMAPLSKVIDELIPEAYFENVLRVPEVEISRDPFQAFILTGLLEERLGWYKTRIRELFAQKKSIYFLFPTEHEARIMHALLARGIEEHSIYISSSLPKKKLADALKKIADDSHALSICGTASYLALPRNDLGTIVIEHESSNSYRRIVAPSFDMRLFAERLARARGIPLVLADLLPRVETYERFALGELADTLPFTFHPELPDKETLISRATGAERGAFKILSSDLVAEIVKTLQSGSRIFLFALRNGLASITNCRDCGETLRCEYCEAPLALYKSGEKRIFICNSCKRHTPTNEKCRRCGGWNLQPFGIGVESLYEECVTLFGEENIIRIDRASITSDKAATETARRFEESSGKILVGTELALHYLTEKVPTVAVVSFDSLFSIPSYRVGERIVELITTIRQQTQDRLIVQTMHPEDRLLGITSKPKLFNWYQDELLERNDFQYPPTTTLIKVVGTFPKATVAAHSQDLAQTLSKWTPDIYTSASPEKKDNIKLHALIRVPKEKWTFNPIAVGVTREQELTETVMMLQENYVIAVNPEDLL
jgi:primosomal protein N' (replication factor Y)